MCNPNDIIMSLSEIRKEKRLTQTKVADMAGMKQQQLSRIELGQCDPSLSCVCKLLSSLGYKLVIEKE